MRQIVGTLLGRWYVTLFGATFLWRSSRHLGWRKTLGYLAVATTVGLLAENGSVHFGFPYTHYRFNTHLRHRELFVGDVPLFVPLSYSFMAYFAYTSGRLLASGPRRLRGRKVWHELMLAGVLAVWALWVLDPVSRLGDRFYLGEVFRYDGPGFWFGLPLGSQIGFALTATVLLAVLHRLARDEPDGDGRGLLDHPHAVSLLTYHAQVFHLCAVALYLGEHTLGGSAILMWVPAAAMTAVHWSNQRTPVTAVTAPTP